MILHSGDFKLDLTPVDGRITDLARIGRIADEHGIRLLLSDSTNAEEPGHTPSERSVGHVLRNLVRDNEGKRIIAACFASHIHRIQQIAEAALGTGRTIATLGRSMAKNVSLARQMGLLHIPDDRLVDIEKLGDFDPAKALVLSTGSQGEPMAALSRIAIDDHRFLKLGPDDTVVLSARAIPGNEKAIGRVMNHIARRGAEVVYEGVKHVHVSGHGSEEELKRCTSPVMRCRGS